MKTTVINLFGGPGIGKSTMAAYLYYLLKSKGVSCELVREYVKDAAWEGRALGDYDQLFITGEQIRREALLLGRANIVITDSPVLIGAEYARRGPFKHVAKGALEMARAFYCQADVEGHAHLHVMLERGMPYCPDGRFETEADARKVDTGLHALLDALQLPTVTLPWDSREAFAEAVIRWNLILNGQVAVATNVLPGNYKSEEAFRFLNEFAFNDTEHGRHPARLSSCFICNRPPDGEVAGTRTYECGHPQ